MLSDFLKKSNIIAVVGVSRNKEKYGYRVYKALKNAGYRVYPINPNADYIDNDKCFPSLSSLPVKVDVVVTVVPPKVTQKVVEEMARLGLKKLWMQPGSESDEVIARAKALGIEFVAKMCFVVDGLNEDLNELAFKV